VEQSVAINLKGGGVMRVDFNTFVLLIIAVEIALVYVKMGKK
jgi:hypothetical protein